MNDFTALPRLWLGVFITAEITAAIALLSALALVRQSIAAAAGDRRPALLLPHARAVRAVVRDQ